MVLEKNNISFIETSALDASNVDTAFENVLSDVFNILNTIQQQQLQERGNTQNGNKQRGGGGAGVKPNTSPVTNTIKVGGKNTSGDKPGGKPNSSCCSS